MQDVEVTVELMSPLSLGRLPYAPTLDSVLLSVLSGARRLTGQAQQELTENLSRHVAVVDGTPAASALWPVTTASIVRHVHSRRSVAQDLTWRTRVKSVVEDRNKYLLKMTARTTIYATKWCWWAHGDAEAIERTLQQVHGIGGKRECGFGAIANLSVRNASWPAWVASGIDSLILGRPVPVSKLDNWLAQSNQDRHDLDWSRHAIVALPEWPSPAWGAGPDVPTVVPLLPLLATQAIGGTEDDV